MTHLPVLFLLYHLLLGNYKTTVYNHIIHCIVMARECNIGAKGKFVRLVGGSISLIMGVIAVGLLYFDVVPSNWFTIMSTFGLFAGGALGIYEGRSGWCVARAMGIRTPI